MNRHIRPAPPAAPGTPSRGAVLLLALLLIVALSVLMIETSKLMQVDMVNAAYHVKGAQAESLLQSGLELTAALLMEDKADEDADHYGENWYTFWDKQKEQAALKFETGELAMNAIVDEAGKFPINGLVNDNGTVNTAMKEMLVRLLENELNLPQLQARTLAAAVVDWVDKDEKITDEVGAESSYYQALKTPYKSRNAAMTSLDELLLVRGVKPELFYDGKGAGLKNYLTVVGTKININTASRPILRAMPQGSSGEDQYELGQDFANAVIQFRSNPDNYKKLVDTQWYRTLIGFESSETIAMPDSSIAVTSNFFTVQMTAKAGDTTRRLLACLERGTPPQAGTPTDNLQAYIRVVFQEVY